MDKRLLKYVAKRPSAWLNCVRVAVAKAVGRKTAVLSTGGFKIRTGVGNGQGLFCAIAGRGYEPEMGWLIDRLERGKMFLDVGANIGVYTLHASKKLGPQGKVYAFEPTPETYEMLTGNVAMNGLPNVETCRLAVGNHCGVLYLVEEGRPASNSTSDDSASGTPVDAVTLDEFCRTRRVSRIDYIKVDIEGGEKAFFEGALATLERDKPLILFESEHTGPDYPERAVLRGIGYKLYVLRDRKLCEITDDSTVRGNVIAIWPEAR